MTDQIIKLLKSKWLLVVAGTHAEFLDYCKTSGLPIAGRGNRKARYVASRGHLFGTKDMPFVVIGTAGQRKDFQDIMIEMRVCNNFEVTANDSARRSTS